MNTLTAEMRRSLKELDLGLKGELTITSDMEDLSNALFFDQVFNKKNLMFIHVKITNTIHNTINYTGATCLDKEGI